jgi:hypothetical protein
MFQSQHLLNSLTTINIDSLGSQQRQIASKIINKRRLSLAGESTLFPDSFETHSEVDTREKRMIQE